MAKVNKRMSFAEEILATVPNKELEAEVLEWMEQVLGKPVELPLTRSLKDGTTLCRLAIAVKPGCLTKIHVEKKFYGMKENIEKFLTIAEGIGVDRSEMFEPEDLLDLHQNIPQVIIGIAAFARKVTRIEDLNVPPFDPDIEAEEEDPMELVEELLTADKGSLLKRLFRKILPKKKKFLESDMLDELN